MYDFSTSLGLICIIFIVDFAILLRIYIKHKLDEIEKKNKKAR